MQRSLIVIAVIGAAAPAHAQPQQVPPPALAIAARLAGGMEGGMTGGELRPTAASFAGLELIARIGEQLAAGVTAEWFHRELPDDFHGEHAVALVLRGRGRRTAWFGGALGWRRMFGPASDPLLGQVVHSGVDLRMEAGGAFSTRGPARLGWFFTWSFGSYYRASYRDLGPWYEARDQVAPPLRSSIIDGMFSTYLFGIRGELGR